MTDKKLISKLYEEFIQLNIKNNPILKYARELNRHFFKEDLQSTEKMFSLSEMQSRITKRCHSALITMAIIKKATTNNC